MKQLVPICFIICLVHLTKAQPLYINTIAGDTISGFSGDGGLAVNAKLNIVMDIAFDSNGNIFICDGQNRRVRKITTSGIITTIAGNGIVGNGGDGGLAINAQLNLPSSLAIDSIGNVYIADYNNNNVRKVSTSGIITTVAGSGIAGYSGDGGLASLAKLNKPSGLAIDSMGNLFIADWNNNCIRKVNKYGVITTIAGNGYAGYSGDGGLATSSLLFHPNTLCFDKAGNLIFSDGWNYCIRKINTANIITTIAGNTTLGFSGDAGIATSAQLSGASAGITTDNFGNLYFIDYKRIRKIDASGIISTIAGTGITGYYGDGGLAINSEFYYLNGGISLNSNGIYVGDYSRIRKISCNNSSNKSTSNCNNFSTSLKETSNISEDFKIYPNPSSNGIIFVELYTEEYKEISITDALGKIVFSKQLTTDNNITTIKIPNLGEGIYNLTLKSNDNTLNRKFIVLN